MFLFLLWLALLSQWDYCAVICKGVMGFDLQITSGIPWVGVVGKWLRCFYFVVVSADQSL